MKVLVTGAGGFIGSHLTELLLREGFDVRAMVRYNSRAHWGNLEHLGRRPPKNLEVVLGDVTDPFLVRRHVKGCDAVLHLAALIGIPYSYHAPGSYISTNVGGALNILEACRDTNVRRIVLTSTSEVYGTARYVPIDEAHPIQAQSPYSASKASADDLALSYHRSYGLPIVILRPFNTYGPRQSARAVIPTILAQALSGAKEIALGNLSPKRDLTFVEDTAQAFRAALTAKGIEGETIHFGQESFISVGDLAKMCLTLAGSNAKIKAASDRRRPVKSEVERLLCKATKAKRLLGWKPKIGLEEGLRRTMDYLRTHLSHYKPGRYTV